MARFKYVNGVRRELTPAEEAQRDADEANWVANEEPDFLEAQTQLQRESRFNRESRLLWVIETLLGELEAIRRGDPVTQRAQALRNRINNL